MNICQFPKHGWKDPRKEAVVCSVIDNEVPPNTVTQSAESTFSAGDTAAGSGEWYDRQCARRKAAHTRCGVHRCRA